MLKNDNENKENDCGKINGKEQDTRTEEEEKELMMIEDRYMKNVR